MGIQRIKIEQQFAQIGVKTTPAKLNIRRPRGQMTIKNERPQLEIDHKRASFKVNNQKRYSESGLKTTGELAKDFRNKGKQEALKAIGQNKDDGNFLANFKIPGDRVAKLAEKKQMARLGPKEFNIGLMPQSPADIEWNNGYMRINWSKHSLVIDYTGEYMPDVSVDPMYSVEVYLRKEPYIRVMVEEAVPASGYYA